jgi:hypothetical protein
VRISADEQDRRIKMTELQTKLLRTISETDLDDDDRVCALAETLSSMLGRMRSKS